MPEHIPTLMDIAREAPELYQYTSTPITDAQRDAYFYKVFKERDEHLAYPFVMRLQANDSIIGTTRYADIRWQHRNLELGFTWFSSRYFGTAVNVESKYLMLRHIFEEMDFLRVQIHTDSRNVRSQAAIKAIGAVYEGVLRAHQIAKEGHIRDTIVFSIIYRDWPQVRDLLEARLNHKLKQQVQV